MAPTSTMKLETFALCCVPEKETAQKSASLLSTFMYIIDVHFWKDKFREVQRALHSMAQGGG